MCSTLSLLFLDDATTPPSINSFKYRMFVYFVEIITYSYSVSGSMALLLRGAWRQCCLKPNPQNRRARIIPRPIYEPSESVSALGRSLQIGHPRQRWLAGEIPVRRSTEKEYEIRDENKWNTGIPIGARAWNVPFKGNTSSLWTCFSV